MTANVGTLDRIIRIIVGLLLIGVALGVFGPDYQSVWGWIGVIPIATAIFGFCPVYRLIGVNTCAR